LALALILIIIIVVFLINKYFENQKEKIGISENIEDALISNQGDLTYVKLKIEGDENVTNLEFIFSNSEKNCSYETDEMASNIEVPLSRNFWSWLFGVPKKTSIYYYEINIQDIGCFNNFHNVKNISLIITYEKEDIKSIDSDKIETTSKKNKTTDTKMGGGGGDGNIGCAPDCIEKMCGDNGCGGSCGACSVNQICESNLCVRSSCINNSECEGDFYCNNNKCFENLYCESEEICNHGYCNSSGNCTLPSCNMNITENHTYFQLAEDFECNYVKEVIYLIGENITIDCKGNKIAPIFITNTSGYNTIKNCDIKSTLFSDERGFLRASSIYVQDRRDYGGSYQGIWRSNTFENNILYGGNSCLSEICCNYGEMIINNTFFDCTMGIGDDEGAHLRVYNNTFYNNSWGIFSGSRLSAGKNNIVQGNEFYNNNVAVKQDNRFHIISNNSFHENNFALVMDDFGAALESISSYGFSNNNITENIFDNNTFNLILQTPGYYVEVYEHANITNYCHTDIWPDCYNNNFSNNLINGRPVYYWYNEHNKVVENVELGYFSCAHCSNITLNNVKLNEPNLYGIFLYNSTNISIKNNEISKSEYCVFFANSSGNLLENNNLNCYINVSEIGSSNNLTLPSLSILKRIVEWIKSILEQ